MKNNKPKLNSTEYKRQLKKEIRRENHKQRNKKSMPICSSCGFDVPEALTNKPYEAHHVEGNRRAKKAGEPEGPVTTSCFNCHAILTDAQEDWQPPLYGEEQTGLTRLARFLQGLKDFLLLIVGWLGAWITYLLDANNKIPPNSLGIGPASPEAIL